MGWNSACCRGCEENLLAAFSRNEKAGVWEIVFQLGSIFWALPGLNTRQTF